MSDYLQQAKEGVAKRDWGFVIFCLTRYFNLSDSGVIEFDATVDIIESLVEQDVLKDIGQKRVLDFLMKIPSQCHTNPKYVQFLEKVEREEDSLSVDSPVVIRKTLHEGKNELIEMVDKGLALMYSYDFDKAISKFQQVLAIDPDYESAKEYLQEAKEYKSGRTRPPRLTQVVTLPLGRAMSMLRAGQYKHAENELISVYKKINELGISEWEELKGLSAEVHDGNNAEILFAEAKEQFRKGELDSAIDKIQLAYDLLRKPYYQDFLQKIYFFKTEVQIISDLIDTSIDTNFDKFIQAEEALQKLNLKFENNFALKSLYARLATKRPLLANSLRLEIRRLISEAEVAQTIDLAREFADKAEHRLKDAGIVDFDIIFLNSVTKEINQLISEINSYQKDLLSAEHLVSDKSNVKTVKQIVARLRQRFPNDPRVTKLKEQVGIDFDTSPAAPDDINSIIQKAKDLFLHQKIEEAIEYLEYNYKITNEIKLRDIAEEYKEIRRIIANLNEVVYSGSVTEVIEISKIIIAMRDKHGDLPISKSSLEKLNDKLLIYLIDSKNEEKAEAASPEQGIAIQGLLIDQSSVSFHDYYRVLNGMILKDPLNQRIQILLSWVKHEIDLNEKQSRNRADRNKSIESFRSQAKAWFILSIVTAVVFLALAIYIILLSTQQEDVWVRLSSLFSILPVFISKLVYDQSLTANRRADEMYEKLMDEDARNVELDRLDEKDIRKKVFQEKSKPRQKKNDSNKNTPNP